MNPSGRHTIGFMIRDVFLVQCEFKLSETWDPDDEFESQFTRERGVAVDDPAGGGSFVQSLKVEATARSKKTGAQCWKISVTYAGIFQHGSGDISKEDAMDNHSCAILYGFAREHIFDLARRSRIPRVLLPPTNFVVPIEESQNTGG